MATDEVPPQLNAASQENSRTPIRVIVADSEPIFRVGVRKIFALEDDVRLVAQAESDENAVSTAAKFGADVILFETELSKTPGETISALLRAAPNLKIVMVTNEPTEELTVEFFRRGAHGIVTRSISPDLLIRCIRKVHNGETWLDNKGVNWMIEAYRAQASQLTSPRARVKLSPKEFMIISGVSQGMRNKDIAQEVGTTEQVVKNYLRKIYDKLGVSDRLELALYCMHHRLLEGYRNPEEAAAAHAATTSPVANLGGTEPALGVARRPQR